jgi:hypothetical protein
MKKPAVNKEVSRDGFLEIGKKVSVEIATDKSKSARDRNTAVANIAKLLLIEHRISPLEDADFFG